MVFLKRQNRPSGGATLISAERLSPRVEGATQVAAAAEDVVKATQHYGRLTRFVRSHFKLGEEAMDIVQDAYARLIKAAERAPIRDSVAFLHVAAANLARDRIRCQAVRHACETADATAYDVECRAPSPERAMISRQQLAIIEQALDELPLKRRAALVLHRFDNLSHAEIAMRLGISVSMVEKHIRWGLKHCRKRLEEAEGGNPS